MAVLQTTIQISGIRPLRLHEFLLLSYCFEESGFNSTLANFLRTPITPSGVQATTYATLMHVKAPIADFALRTLDGENGRRHIIGYEISPMAEVKLRYQDDVPEELKAKAVKLIETAAERYNKGESVDCQEQSEPVDYVEDVLKPGFVPAEMTSVLNAYKRLPKDLRQNILEERNRFKRYSTRIDKGSVDKEYEFYCSNEDCSAKVTLLERGRELFRGQENCPVCGSRLDEESYKYVLYETDYNALLGDIAGGYFLEGWLYDILSEYQTSRDGVLQQLREDDEQIVRLVESYHSLETHFREIDKSLEASAATVLLSAKDAADVIARINREINETLGEQEPALRRPLIDRTLGLSAEIEAEGGIRVADLRGELEKFQDEFGKTIDTLEKAREENAAISEILNLVRLDHIETNCRSRRHRILGGELDVVAVLFGQPVLFECKHVLSEVEEVINLFVKKEREPFFQGVLVTTAVKLGKDPQSDDIEAIVASRKGAELVKLCSSLNLELVVGSRNYQEMKRRVYRALFDLAHRLFTVKEDVIDAAVEKLL